MKLFHRIALATLACDIANAMQQNNRHAYHLLSNQELEDLRTKAYEFQYLMHVHQGDALLNKMKEFLNNKTPQEIYDIVVFNGGNADNGRCSLHFAAAHGKVEFMEYILAKLSPQDRRAAMGVKDRNGQLPFDAATPEVMLMLMDKFYDCITEFDPIQHAMKNKDQKKSEEEEDLDQTPTVRDYGHISKYPGGQRQDSDDDEAPTDSFTLKTWDDRVSSLQILDENDECMRFHRIAEMKKWMKDGKNEEPGTRLRLPPRIFDQIRNFQEGPAPLMLSVHQITLNVLAKRDFALHIATSSGNIAAMVEICLSLNAAQTRTGLTARDANGNTPWDVATDSVKEWLIDQWLCDVDGTPF